MPNPTCIHLVPVAGNHCIDGIRIENHGGIPERVGQNKIYLTYFVHRIE